MAEQLRLEQAFRERPTVQREERALDAHRELVEVTGDDFLPGARFSLDQHGAFRGRDLLGEPEHVAKQPGLAERLDLPGALAAADFLLELLVLGAQAPVLGGAAANRHHVVVREGLLYIVESALIHRLNGCLQRCLGGHQNDGGLRVLPPHG